MIDNHCRGSPLGLSPFTGIVDDEGIDVRQRAKDRFRVATVGQRQRLAGQPFQIAVLAVVQNGLCTEVLAQPHVEGEVTVRRHQCGIVVGLCRVDVVATCRLDRHGDIAVELYSQLKRTVAHKGVVFRCPPAGLDIVAQFLR